MSVETAIQRTIAQFKEGVTARNAATVAACYGVGARLLPPNSDFIVGQGAIERFWQGALDLGIHSADLETLEVEDYGDTAIEVGAYRLFFEGNTLADSGKYIVVWKRQNGDWKMFRDIWNSSQAAPAPAA